jgi:hypothetical protein
MNLINVLAFLRCNFYDGAPSMSYEAVWECVTEEEVESNYRFGL